MKSVKKAITSVFLTACGAITAFADEAMPEVEHPAAVSAHPLADMVLPWVGVAIAAALIAVILLYIINRGRNKPQ